MEKKNYIPLKELEVYQLARQLSKMSWSIYDSLSWQDKKIKKLEVKLNNFITVTFNKSKKTK